MELKVIIRKSVQESPWATKYNEGHTVNVNGHNVNREYWNLLLSKRDFSLYAKGMKPYRNWSFNEAKKYFGLTGSAERVANDITLLVGEVQQSV